jgi:hypothetical protein
MAAESCEPPDLGHRRETIWRSIAVDRPAWFSKHLAVAPYHKMAKLADCRIVLRT